MRTRSRWSITGSAFMVLIGLAIQSSRPTRAQTFGENPDEYMSVRASAATCVGQSVPAAQWIAACTTIIRLADHGSYAAEQQIGAIYVARARAFQEEGNDRAALRDFDTATQKEPRNELSWLGLGNYYMGKSEYPRALESFDQAVKVGHNDPVVYDDRGAALVALKRDNEALTDFARAIALDPHDTAALSNRATVYLASDRAELAIADLSTVIRIEPTNAKALYNRGVAYERTEAPDRAVEDFRSAVRIQPSLDEAYEALGRVLAKKDPQAGIAVLTEAIRLDPRSPALKSRAILYLSLGRFELAISDLDQVIADDGDDETAYMNRGVAEEEIGNLQMALADYSRSIDIETTAPALVDRGSIYLRLGQPQKALGDFDAALAIEPDDVAALSGRADANYAPDERGPDRLAASLSDYSRVIAASPKNAAAYFVRGNIHFDLKQYAAAYDDFSESLELQPDQPAVLFNLALAAEHLGHSAEAARDREAARRLDASMGSRVAAGAREAAGSPTQIEYAVPRNGPEEPRVVFAAPLAAPEAAPEMTLQGPRPEREDAQRSSPARENAQEVTVVAQRAKLAPKVREFVNQIVAPENEGEDGIARWKEPPVCPLVSGLAQQQAEFILERLSEIARNAGVPLAGQQKCRPNLYVLVTTQPEELLRGMEKRNRPATFGYDMFGNSALNMTETSRAVVDEFIRTPRAVRVWYNATAKDPWGQSLASCEATQLLPICNATWGLNLPTNSKAFDNLRAQTALQRDGVPFCDQSRFYRCGRGTAGGSLLTLSAISTFSRVFVIVDQTRLQGVAFGQLADYVAMVGFVRLNPHARLGDIPTILKLFDGVPQVAPAGMTDWDQAFLKSLYATDQRMRMQRSQIARAMVRDIAH